VQKQNLRDKCDQQVFSKAWKWACLKYQANRVARDSTESSSENVLTDETALRILASVAQNATLQLAVVLVPRIMLLITW